MSPVAAQPLPDDALLQTYARAGAYTDCYAIDVEGAVSHQDYVTAFYTTWVFRLERFILRWLVSRPSTDLGARQLAAGQLEKFAAWTVEARAENQLLLCDFLGSTRSWLMTQPLANGAATRLYFGSAVVPKQRPGKTPAMGLHFRALLGFHQLYSRILLTAAGTRLAQANFRGATPSKP